MLDCSLSLTSLGVSNFVLPEVVAPALFKSDPWLAGMKFTDVCSQTRKQWTKRSKLRQLRVKLYACTSGEIRPDEQPAMPTVSSHQATQRINPSSTIKSKQIRPKGRAEKRGKGKKVSMKAGRRK